MLGQAARCSPWTSSPAGQLKQQVGLLVGHCTVLTFAVLCCVMLRQMVNLTTSTYTYVFEGHLPSGEALSGLTGLKVVDIREHHISGAPLPR